MDTIRLSGFGYRAEICPERGANLIALQRPALGIDALRTPQSAEDFVKADPYLWGVPILFPPNRISGAAFEFEGRQYRLPMNEPKIGNHLHGLMHQTALTCVEHDAVHAVFAYRANAYEYMNFPHAFEMRVCYALSDEGMRQSVAILNRSEQNMPVALGFHTTFSIPFAQGGRAQDVRLKLDVDKEYPRDMHTYLPTGEVWTDFDLRAPLRGDGIVPGDFAISRHFSMGSSRKMELRDTVRKVKIVYQADANYQFWMVYNGGRKDLVCVEPQTWLNNCPNAPFDRAETGFSFLAPGEQRVYETRFALEEWEDAQCSPER